MKNIKDEKEKSNPKQDGIFYEPGSLQDSNHGSIVPGIIITGIFVVLMLIFDISLLRSALLPTKILVPVIVLLVFIMALIGFLTHRTNRRGRFATGTVISVLMAAVMIYGGIAMNKVTNTLNTITTASAEVSDVCVYVLESDSAEALSDLEEDSFGIMSEIDRDSTDSAVDLINEELGTTIATVEYDGVADLVNALYDQECRSIVLNSAYIDVISEYEGYEDIEDKVREVYSLEVEEANVDTENTEEMVEDTEAANSDSTFIMYISGIDSRNGLISKSRSDVNILATVNTETHQILLVSTPRDYYVPLSISDGVRDKLTHAGIYGVSVSMDTLAMLYDIDVDYYFRVSFEGFEDIVDALGGVSVYSDYTFTSSFIDHTFTEGYNDVNGKQALAFARERYAFAEGDRQRGKDQMALIEAIIDKAISPDILVKYSSILTAVEDNFETSMSYDMIASMVNDQLDSGADWNIVTYSVDGTGTRAVPYSMNISVYVMVPDEETVATAKEMMQDVLNGEIIETDD